MAGIPSSAQTAAISSGEDAPSRKLNAERACSSTYSVIARLHEPALARQIAVHAIKRQPILLLHRDVPLVAAPAVVAPPLTRCAPRPRARRHLAAHVEERHPHRLPAMGQHVGPQRRTIPPHRQLACPRTAVGFVFSGDWQLGTGNWREAPYPKRIRPMRIQDLSDAKILFSHYSRYP